VAVVVSARVCVCVYVHLCLYCKAGSYYSGGRLTCEHLGAFDRKRSSSVEKGDCSFVRSACLYCQCKTHLICTCVHVQINRYVHKCSGIYIHLHILSVLGFLCVCTVPLIAVYANMVLCGPE